jgi:hypothetical protein
MRITADWSGATEPGPTSQLMYGQAEDFWVMIPEAVLPVVFGSIEAKIINNIVMVNWTSEQETNNNRFEIEASKDGNNFVKIGEIKSLAEGNSSQAISYSFSKDIKEVSVLLGISIVALMLGAGFSYRRKKKLAQLLAIGGLICLMFLFATGSCKKAEVPLQTDKSKLFIRIKQIDTDGNFMYSKIVQAVNN